jgi:hypothetical protein
LRLTRVPDDEEDLPVLERLLRDARPDVHVRLAALLWEATEPADALARANALATEMPPVSGEAGEVATAHG